MSLGTIEALSRRIEWRLLRALSRPVILLRRSWREEERGYPISLVPSASANTSEALLCGRERENRASESPPSLAVRE